jgi:phosphate transport system substrate-binding protein
VEEKMSRKTVLTIAAALLATALLAGLATSSGADAAAAAVTAKAKNPCGAGHSVRPGYRDMISLRGGANSLSGAGSTFVAPMMSIWSAAYAKSSGVQVAYQSIGSGGGQAQISAGTIDFGDSDIPMTNQALAQAKGAILHIPLVLGAVVPAYNVKGVGAGLHFTGELLGRIFAGEITRWNDPALAKLNPGVKLPDEPIAVAHRSDGSGTTGIWTDYLTKTSPSWVNKLGGAAQSRGLTVAWPVGIGGKGNEGVSAVVNQTEGGIGYLELAYAVQQHITFGDVQNRAGNFVHACVATTSLAASVGRFPANLRTSLTNEPGDYAFPITGTTYALVYENQTDAAKAKALVAFLGWVLSKGQDMAAQINYAPLGKSLQTKSVGQLYKITLNGKPVARRS